MDSGIDEGFRNFGRLALAWIPYALACGAAAWFGVYLALRQFRREQSQEERAAVYVGAGDRPKSKIAIELPERGRALVTRVDIDGTSLRIYIKNPGRDALRFVRLRWQAVSPDGTVLVDATDYAPDLQPGDKAEMIVPHYVSKDLADPRIKTLRAWVE